MIARGESYKIKTFRFIDGRRVDGFLTATVKAVFENYTEPVTGELVAVGYKVSMHDSTNGKTRSRVLSEEELTNYWINESI